MDELKKIQKIIKDKSDYMITSGATVLGSLVSDVFMATGIPVVANMILIYKQKKFEKNVLALVDDLNKKSQKIEEHLMSADNIDNFRDYSFPILLEYVINENQEEKIEFYTNIIIELLKQSKALSNESKIDKNSFQLILFRTLSELTFYEVKLFIDICLYKNLEHVNIDNSNAIQITDSDDLELIIRKQALNNLKKRDLIYTPTVFGEMGGEGEYLHRLDSINITYYGKQFYNYLKDKNDFT